MSAASFDGRGRYETADVAQPPSENTGSPVSPNTAKLPSIEEAMMAGGYYFGGSQTSLLDAVADTGVLQHSSDNPTATTMADTAPLLPPMVPHPVVMPVVTPPHKNVASLSSLTGTTPTPSNSNPNSTDTTPVAGQSQQHHRGGSASLNDAQQQQQRIAKSNTRAASTSPSNRLSVPPPAAPAAAAASMTSPRHRASPATTNTTAAAAATASARRPVPQPLSPAESSVPAGEPLPEDHSVDYTTPHAQSNKAESRHPAPPPANAGSTATNSPNTGARRRYTVATTRTAPPPPLSPQKENYSPMRRVTMTPQTSSVAAAAAAAAAAVANGATSPDGAARGPVSSLLASRLLGPNSSQNSSVTAAAAAAVPGSTPNSNSATLPTNAFTSPGPLAAPALRPHPPAGSPSHLSVSAATSPSRRARLTLSRHATPNKSSKESPEVSQGETTSPAEEEASAPSENVPLWLAQLNNILVKQNNTNTNNNAALATQQAPSSLEDSAAHADLANHRTFSQAVTSSAEDWLNPCNRPKGLSAHSPFYAAQMHAQDQQPAATAAGLPPGVTAALHDQYMREEMGSGSCSQTSQTDTNTNTDASRGTPKTGSISNSDVIPPGSNNTAPFIGGRWRAEDGAPVRRQYPSRNPSLAGSVASAESGGFIPISREQRTMSPQSQRWESSGCISLNSSVAESALPQQGGGVAAAAAVPAAPSFVAAPVSVAAPVGLVRRQASTSVASRVSEDIMAPVRLGGHGGTTTHAALLSASTATMTTTTEMVQLAEVASEPLVMPPMARAFSLQPALCSGEDLSLHTRGPAGPQRYVPSTESALGSASVLSTNEGPSSMRLPLARFMRNTSSGSAMNGFGHLQQQPLQQQQQPLAYVQPPSPSTGGRRGGPAVLSLRPESPPTDSPQVKDAAPHSNVGSSGGRRVASWDRQSPHQQQQQQQPLRQGQVQTLDEDLEYTASLTLTPTDAFSNASRATSALSLAAETTFVRCD